MSFLVITYGKLFANAAGRKYKLDEKSLKNLSIKQIILHRDLIILRNKYVAHAWITKLGKLPGIIVEFEKWKGN